MKYSLTTVYPTKHSGADAALLSHRNSGATSIAVSKETARCLQVLARSLERAAAMQDPTRPRRRLSLDYMLAAIARAKVRVDWGPTGKPAAWPPAKSEVRISAKPQTRKPHVNTK